MLHIHGFQKTDFRFWTVQSEDEEQGRRQGTECQLRGGSELYCARLHYW